MSDSASGSGLLTFSAPNNTMGALFIGVFLSAVLWGISTMQVYEYFLLYYNSDEPNWIKLMVTAVYALDTADQVLMCHVLYSYLVSHYANPEFLEVLIWSFPVVVLLSTLVGFFVQSFFTWRVWKFSKKNPFIIVLVLLTLGNCGAGIAYFAKSLKIKSFEDLPSIDGLSKSMNALGAGTDVAISAALVFWLHSAKSAKGQTPSDAIMNRLIFFCLNTGLLSTACALLSLIFICVLPNTFIYMTFYCMLGRIYTNSLLASLNARARIRAEREAGITGFSLSSNGNVEFSTPKHGIPVRISRHITINKDVESETHTDYEMKPVNTVA